MQQVGGGEPHRGDHTNLRRGATQWKEAAQAVEAGGATVVLKTS